MTALEKLQEAATEAAAREVAAQREKETELAALDARIAELQRNLGQPGGGGGTLDQLYALLKTKETQDAELEKLKREQEQARRQREAEIARLKDEAEARRAAEFGADYVKYLAIADSPLLDEAVKNQAWEAIVAKWKVDTRTDTRRRLVWENGMVVQVISGKTMTLDLGQGVKLNLVLIPPGEFMMGSEDGAEDEKPARRVRITEGFWLGEYEVTQEQYEAVMGSNPSTHKSAKKPVHNVSWDDAVAFLDRLNRQVKLPKVSAHSSRLRAVRKYVHDVHVQSVVVDCPRPCPVHVRAQSESKVIP